MNTNPNAVTFDELLNAMDNPKDVDRHRLRRLAIRVVEEDLTFVTGDTVLQD